MKIINLRIQIAAGDDAKLEDVKPLIRDAVRAIGARNLAPDPDDITKDMIVLFEAADVKQGPETVKRKAKP